MELTGWSSSKASISMGPDSTMRILWRQFGYHRPVSFSIPTPIKIRNVNPAGTSWTVASNGIDWVVAFQEGDSDSALALLRVTAAGSVVQGPTVVVPSTYFLRSNLRLAFTNGVFLFTWAEFSDTQALLFDSNLTVLRAAYRLVSGESLAT